MRRSRLAAAAAGAIAAAGGAVALRAAWLEPRRARLREIELRLPNWPHRLDGLRVALVSDLHAGAPFVGLARVERIARAVGEAAPDLVALLGDYVDPEVKGASAVDPAAVAATLASIEAPLGRVAVLGNHDWIHTGHRMGEALRGAGVPVLENEALRLDARGGALWIAGLADASTRRPSAGTALASVPRGEPVIVLSHDPDAFPYVPARAALTLSGHTHGGQVALPGIAGRVIPSRHGTRYAAGHVVEQGRHLFVGRGIGTSRLPLRLRAAPEVPVLRLRADAR